MKDQYTIFIEALKDITNQCSTYQCTNHFFGKRSNGAEIYVSVSLVILKSGHFQISIIEKENIHQKNENYFLAQYALYGEILLKDNLIILASDFIPPCSSTSREIGKLIFNNRKEVVLDLTVRDLLYLFNTPIKLYKTIAEKILINGETFHLNINQSQELLC